MRSPISRILALATLALFVASLSAVAELAPVGREIGVNFQISSDQGLPDLAMRDDGYWVASWQHGRGSNLQVRLRLFNANDSPHTGDLSPRPTATTTQTDAKVAFLSDGSFVVTWQERIEPSSPAQIWAARFDAQGVALGNAFKVSLDPSSHHAAPRVATASDGRWAIAWAEFPTDLDPRLQGQIFDAEDQPLVAPFRIDDPFSGLRQLHDLAFDGSGQLIALWNRRLSVGEILSARRIDRDGLPSGSTINIEANYRLGVLHASLAVFNDDSLAVIWHGSTIFSPPILTSLHRFDSANQPLGAPIDLNPNAAFDITASHGELLMVASLGQDIWAFQLNKEGLPIGEKILVNTFQEFDQTKPVVAVAADGTFMVAWQSGEEQSPVPILPPPAGTQDGDGLGIYAQRVRRLCVRSEDRLCLNQGRFSVQVEWTRPQTGQILSAKTLPLTNDSGGFWFFKPDNLELVVKVLDGRPVNGHFWVFWGGLSNVRYALRVRDELTGEERTYQNPQGRLAGGRDTTSFTGQALLASSLSAIGNPMAASQKISPPIPPPPPPPLLLHEGRFLVELRWVDSNTGARGFGSPTALSNESGYFTLFGPDNIEVMIKVLDGRPVNGNFWVLYGSLTHLQFTLTVIDLNTGLAHFYHSARGEQASGVDTQSFLGELPPFF